MTLSEFKAWLSGFEEAFTSYGPDRDQWLKIKAKLDAVTVAGPAPALPLFLPREPRTHPLTIGDPWPWERTWAVSDKRYSVRGVEAVAAAGRNQTVETPDIISGLADLAASEDFAHGQEIPADGRFGKAFD